MLSCPAGRISPLLALALVLAGLVVPSASAYPRPAMTELVSVATDGSSADADASNPSMSADGRYLALASGATNLVEGSLGNLFDVYVRDRLTDETELVSIGNDGEPREGWSLEPDISGDGRYVAFTTTVAFDGRDKNQTWDVYVRDRDGGTTTLATLSSTGKPIDWGASDPEISDDGRIVSFASGFPEVVTNDTNSTFDVFARDLVAGTTELLSIGTNGTQLPTETYWHEMSADGRYVTLDNIAPVPETDGLAANWQVFVRDRVAGTTELVSIADDGTRGNATSYESNISADGMVVSFASYASNLVPGSANVGSPEVYVRDRVRRTTERVCVAHDGSDPDGSCFTSALSPDGRYVAFDSQATNLVPGDTNGESDLFLYDRLAGTMERVSVASDGTQATGHAYAGGPGISRGGEVVSFVTDADALELGDTDGNIDVFVRLRGPEVGVSGLAASADDAIVTVSGRATFSAVFTSEASDPANDGSSIGNVAASDVGAELTGASVAYRPESEDLLVRWRLAGLPGAHLPPGLPEFGIFGPGLAPGVAGSPAVVYGLELSITGTPFEIRGSRASATTVLPGAHAFALYRCDRNPCEQVARLVGEVGQTGTSASAVVPLSALGAQPGGKLEGLRALSGIGEVATGIASGMDQATLPDASLPVTKVTLALIPAGEPPAEEAFTDVAVSAGRFTATRSHQGFPPGSYEAWVRGCLGDSCGIARASIVVPG